MHHETDRTPEPQRQPVMMMNDGRPAAPRPQQDHPDTTPGPTPPVGPPGSRLGTTALALSASMSGFLVVASLIGSFVERNALMMPLSPLLLAALAPLLLGPCAVACTAAALHPGLPRRQGLIGIGLVILPFALFALNVLVHVILGALPRAAW